MFVPWDSLLKIITDHCLKNKFLDNFEHTTHSKKISLCVENGFIRNCLEQWLISDEFNDSLKNSEKSKVTRLRANEKFKNNCLEECCKLYTKAAQYALYNSMDFALAFSNRSAVYMRLKRHQDCLKDIDICLNILENLDVNSKEINKGQLVIKLLKRKIDCLIDLKHYKEGRICWDHLLDVSVNIYNIPLEDTFTKKCQVLLDFDNKADLVEKIDETVSVDLIIDVLEKNKITLPFKSTKLTLCCTEEKGKHFIASKNIKKGELLIFENPFAFVLLPEYYNQFCYNCCLQLKHSIPCEHCCTILFCNEKCRKESWDSFHSWECKQGISILKCIGIAHLALRLTFKTLHPDSKNNDQVNDLLTHIDDLDSTQLLQYSLTAALLLLYLKNKTDFFEKHPSLDFDSVGKDLLFHMTRLVCNGNAISSHLLLDSHLKTLSSIVEQSEPRIGTAIFPTSSLLNHSCDPNIFSSNILNYVVIKATRDIKEGEEITNCYGPSFRRMRYFERQTLLKNQYHFECKCSICIDPHKNDKLFQIIEGIKCKKCQGDLEMTFTDLNASVQVSCYLCNTKINAMVYNHCLSRADKLYNKGIEELEKNNLSEGKYNIEMSLIQYCKILNKKNFTIAKCENSLGKCYAASGDFINSYKYLLRCIKWVEEHYGENSLEAAYEFDKISDIMLTMNNDSQLNETILEYVRKSMNIFITNLSAWDIPYNEACMKHLKFKETVLLKMLKKS